MSIDKSNEINNNTKIERIQKGINKFYETNIAFYVFLGILAFSFLIQLILFLILDDFLVNGVSSTDSDSWKAWVYIAISLPAASLGLIGWVFTVRVHRYFLVPTALSLMITFVTSILGGMMWTSISFIICLISIFARVKKINNEGVDYTYPNWMNYAFISFVISFFVLGIALINIDATTGFWWRLDSSDGNLIKYFDVAGGTLLALGYLLLQTKSKWAFIVLFINNLVLITLFVLTNQYITATQSFIYIIANTTGLINWIGSKKDLEFNEVEEIVKEAPY